MRSGSRNEDGFAYVMLLVAVALIALAASASLSLGAAMARRDHERQLLAIGLEFQQAIRGYAGLPAGTTLAMTGAGPRNLDDLLRDPRVPGIRRHLRQLYADPLTGGTEWGVLRDTNGAIVGIHSLAEGRPIQREGFDPALRGFEDAADYRQWVFGIAPAAPRP